MYFPYLRARKEEVEAIVTTLCREGCDNVIPILYPSTDDEEELYTHATLKKAIINLVQNNRKFICVISEVNDLAYLKQEICSDKFDECCIYGFYNSFPLIKNFKYGAVLHNEVNSIIDSSSIDLHIFMPDILQKDIFFSNKFPKEKSVYITDSFDKKDKNSSYGTEDLFKNSSLCYNYKNYGLAGFGDFTILEKDYIVPSGGNPTNTTHVLHLTKECAKNCTNLYVRHFLTTPVEKVDISERSKSTIKKAYNNKDEFLRTKGIEMIENLFGEDRSTSLGMYKRIGIIHHISLINNIIK